MGKSYITRALRSKFIQKQLVVATLASLSWGSLSAQTSGCPNADFSLGNFTNWSGTTGSCCPINTPTNGIVNGRHTIMTGGTDPQTGNQLQQVCPGYQFSARIGNNGTGAQAEGLSYTLNPVSNANSLFIYNYAVVLEDPGHSASQQPRFELSVRDNTSNNVIPCTLYSVTAAGNIPGFQTFSGNRWKNWTTVGVDLANYNGQQVTIQARTGDCSLGGHFGYAYMVASCRPRQIVVEYCPGATSATLTAPPGFAAYLWQPGNVTTQTITLNNPVPGSQYSCTITSVTGCQATLNAIVNPILVTADFTVQDGCNGRMVFTDNSTVVGGQAEDWIYDFGDGTTSTGVPNPTHVYTTPGTYNVQLITVSNGGCTDTIVKPVLVTPIITPNFTHNAGCGLTVNFTNTSTVSSGNIVGVSWDFDDQGATSTQNNPTHTFSNPGTYDVRLIATSNFNCSDTIFVPVTVYSIPQAAFAAPQVCHPAATNFTDQTVVQGAQATSWSWDFGDGNTSTTQNPSNTYTNPGFYNVTLMVEGPGGCRDTITQQINSPATPVAGFIQPGICGLNATFTDTSTTATGTVSQWSWNFGDPANGTSTQQNPTYLYPTGGTWNVTLTATTNFGCSNTVTVPYTNLSMPVADFTQNNVCDGFAMQFNNTTIIQGDSISGYAWDFGHPNATATNENPTNLFPSAGTYNVTLAVQSANGCPDTVVKQIVVYPNPRPDFTAASVCTNVPMQFNNNSQVITGTIASYLWSFGTPGIPQSNLQNPAVPYGQWGTFDVTLQATTNFGCVSTITKPVTVHPRPAVDFTADPVIGCMPLEVQFTNTSTIPGTNTIATYAWNLGDGALSSVTDPFHIYQINGTYNVSLYAVSDKGCDSTITRQNYITVWPKPIAGFMHKPDYPTTVRPLVEFIDLSTGATGWNWTLGDGGTSTAQNFYHTYSTDTATYTVTQIVNNQFGCLDTIQHDIIIKPDFTVYIPNTFTPNGDGFNEEFMIHGVGLVEAKMFIYDRWGEKLVTLENMEPMKKGWDGYYNGKPIKQDVYVYRIQVRDIFGDWHEFHGQVNLVR